VILSRGQLIELREEWRKAEQRVVFTNGCFDLIHLGHVRYLQEARQLGDLLIVGLNSDASVRHLKGPQRPLVLEGERAEVMSALRPVDYVVIFDEPTARQIVSELQPDIYVKGGDYKTGESGQGKFLPEAEIVYGYGGQVALIPFVPGHSTTELINKILDAYAIGAK
jgi:D-beta-D-heptose 7-phosphate kinase/D-beta-D-heptose 1-phosphate adenosyltransferase